MVSFNAGCLSRTALDFFFFFFKTVYILAFQYDTQVMSGNMYQLQITTQLNILPTLLLTAFIYSTILCSQQTHTALVICDSEWGTSLFIVYLEYNHSSGTFADHHEIRDSTESWPWRKIFSPCSCQTLTETFASWVWCSTTDLSLL